MSTLLAPFKADRFSSTVPHYVEGRLNYPPRLIERVAAALDVKPGERLLDLGCGPGFLAVAFAKLGCLALGLDPEKAMLVAAREFAAREGVHCEFREGSSFELSPALGRFKLACMGRSFHWMDRAETLAALNAMIEMDGAVALFHDRHIDCAENRWEKALDEVRDGFGTRGDLNNLRSALKVEPHMIVALASPFSLVDTVGLVERRTLGVERAVSRALSYSGSSPAAMGERRAAFESAVREAVSPFAKDGLLSEVVEFTAYIARRP
jgi:SAM-dependent methyltransferase